MNINEMKELIAAVSQSELTGFDYVEGNLSISLRKGGEAPVVMTKAAEAPAAVVTVQQAAPVAQKAQETPVAEEQPAEVTGNIVRSPLVGTAYVSAEEGGEPLVKVGDTVKVGQTLIIVEAMKLMNEIQSDYAGVVKEILVENGQIVEYDQPLFVIG
ncbi:MAG: acetyl-CoA carboxylase biotin carboxyl carrier protein [Lachnospiraceae bacterium]|nr:acetyl-CoA carboxylase biotin carboxyl carrier protein [Lachnospiraceae bacterium]MDY3819595.1 acetyl-CoA carboxylase biotin carboxyl carrier protein [Lachnospiraceae bacterium]